MKQIPFRVTSTASKEWSQLTAIWKTLLGNGTTLVGTGVPLFDPSAASVLNWTTLTSDEVLPEKTNPWELAAANRLWAFKSAPSCTLNNFALECILNCKSCMEGKSFRSSKKLPEVISTNRHIDTIRSDLCHRCKCNLIVNTVFLSFISH